LGRGSAHVEARELDYVPQHLIVIGGGYSGLELAQAYRRFGSDVTVIEAGPQLLAREDIDVSQEARRFLGDEGIQVLVGAELLEVPRAIGRRGYAETTYQRQGFMKAVVADGEDRILGFTMIGAAAGEVMAAVHTAMLAGLSYAKLADADFAHPTMAEGLSSLFSAVPPRAVQTEPKAA